MQWSLTPTPPAPAATTPPGSRFHDPGVPYTSATADEVVFATVTLHPTGFTELSRNDVGLKLGLPLVLSEIDVTGGEEIDDCRLDDDTLASNRRVHTRRYGHRRAQRSR